MHRRLAVPILPLRVWVHCPRASNGLLPPRSNLVGYVRWYARSDSVLLSSFRQSFQQLSGRKRVNLTLPIREGLPTILPESIHPHQPAQSIIARTHGSNLWQKIGPSRAHTRENDA